MDRLMNDRERATATAQTELRDDLAETAMRIERRSTMRDDLMMHMRHDAEAILRHLKKIEERSDR